MFCPHCGSNIPDGSRFCSNCGNPIEQSASSGYQGAQPNAPQQQYGGPVPPQESFGGADGQYDASAQQGAAGALRTDRDIIVYVLLSIVTCGIYGYWYIYQMAQDANTICCEDGEETPGLLIYILLSIVTCGIYSYYWMYKLANRLQANGPRYGIVIQEGGSDVLLWLLLGLVSCGICSFIAMNILIKNMNKLSDGYNHAYGYYG